MQEKLLIIKNEIGLHARPAALFAQAAKKFAAEIWLEKGTNRVNAKSITAIMQLAAKCGDKVKVVAQGSDESEAVSYLEELVENKFGEEAK